MGWGELATREEARNRAMKSWAWVTLGMTPCFVRSPRPKSSHLYPSLGR